MRNGQNKRMRGRNRNHKSHHSGWRRRRRRRSPSQSADPGLRIERPGGEDPRNCSSHRREVSAARPRRPGLRRSGHRREPLPARRALSAPDRRGAGAVPGSRIRTTRRRPHRGRIRDEAFDGDEEDGGQPGQGQPVRANRSSRSSSSRRTSAASRTTTTTSSRPIRRASSRSLTAASRRTRTIRAASAAPASRTTTIRQPPQYQPPQRGGRSDGERLPSFITGGAQPAAERARAFRRTATTQQPGRRRASRVTAAASSRGGRRSAAGPGRTRRRISAATRPRARQQLNASNHIEMQQGPGICPALLFIRIAAPSPPGDGASTGSSAGTRRRFSRAAGIAR